MKYLFLLLLVMAANLVIGQNAPAPDYLTTQDFPDSVKSLGVETLEGRRLTFGEMIETYKGEKVFIDIWASWCRDCIVGYPKLQALRKEVGQENVAYVFLSADKDILKWKGAIDRFKISGEHYLLDGAWTNTLSSYVVLDWVPRYMVLDESGKVIVPKAVLAEDPALKTALLNK